MKITKTQQPERKFEPVRITFDLNSPAEVNAFFAISRWDITVPSEAITGVGATRADVYAMIKRFQALIEGYWSPKQPQSLPRVEVIFESPWEADEAKRTERIPGLAAVLQDEKTMWSVRDTVYLRGFHPKRTIQFAPEGQYKIVDEEGNVQCGPGTAAEMSRWVLGPNSMYTHEVQKRKPCYGDMIYHDGDARCNRRITATASGARITNKDGTGHHYEGTNTLEKIEELIDQGVYTYEPKWVSKS